MQCTCTCTCTGVGAHTGWPSECLAEEHYNNITENNRPETFLAITTSEKVSRRFYICSLSFMCSPLQFPFIHKWFLHTGSTTIFCFEVYAKCTGSVRSDWKTSQLLNKSPVQHWHLTNTSQGRPFDISWKLPCIDISWKLLVFCQKSHGATESDVLRKWW